MTTKLLKLVSIILLDFIDANSIPTRPFLRGTVPFGGFNVPFGSALKPTMCPLAPLLDQRIFNSYLNYLRLKVSVVRVELD